MSIVHLCHNLNCWKQRKLELNNTHLVFFYSFVSLFKQNVYLKIWKNDISWLLIEYLKLWFDQSRPTIMFRFTVCEVSRSLSSHQKISNPFCSFLYISKNRALKRYLWLRYFIKNKYYILTLKKTSMKIKFV